MTYNEDWAACDASVDPGLMEAVFAELAADPAPVYRRRDLWASEYSGTMGRVEIHPAWASGDEVCGRSAALREFLETAGIGYVFAVPVDHQLTTSGGPRMRADQALHLVKAEGWNRRSCGSGAKGPRYYDWAWIATGHPRRQLLIRRSLTDPSEVAYFYAYAPEYRASSMTDLVEIAGRDGRWRTISRTRNPSSHSTRHRSGSTGVETPRHPGDGGPRVPRCGHDDATRLEPAGTTTEHDPPSSHGMASDHDLRLEY